MENKEFVKINELVMVAPFSLEPSFGLASLNEKGEYYAMLVTVQMTEVLMLRDVDNNIPTCLNQITQALELSDEKVSGCYIDTLKNGVYSGRLELASGKSITMRSSHCVLFAESQKVDLFVSKDIFDMMSSKIEKPKQG